MNRRIVFLVFFALLTHGPNASSLWAQTIVIDDDIESYTLGDAVGPQADHWSTWSGIEGGGEDPPVSDDQAASGNHSVRIQGGGTVDAMVLLGDRTGGIYTVEFKLFIPTGKQAYYNIQHFENAGVEWASEIFFNTGGSGALSAGGASVVFPWTEASWMTIRQEVDLNADWTELFIDGISIHTWAFSDEAGAPGGTRQLGGINFYPADASHLYYIDDLQLLEVEPPPVPQPVTFQVDMSMSAVSPAGVHLAGDFQAWDPAATGMSEQGGGIWTVTVDLVPQQVFRYKFINGSTWPEEELLPAACGISDGIGGYYRIDTMGASSTILEPVCFGECRPCITGTGQEEDLLGLEGLRLWPVPAKDYIRVDADLDKQRGQARVQLLNAQGRLLMDRPLLQGQATLSLENQASGMYIIRIVSEQRILTARFPIAR